MRSGEQVVAWTGPFLLPVSFSLALPMTYFKKINVVQSTENLNADVLTLFLLTEFLNESFNFSKSLFLHL